MMAIRHLRKGFALGNNIHDFPIFSFLVFFCMDLMGHGQGCQIIFIGETYRNGKNLPNDHKIYEIDIKYLCIPNRRKIFQMTLKCTNIKFPRPSKIYPNLDFG
jgi:hypothetical protein